MAIAPHGAVQPNMPNLTKMPIGSPPYFSPKSLVSVLTTLGPDRVHHVLGKAEVRFLSKADLILNKRATGRAQDLADLESLEG